MNMEDFQMNQWIFLVDRIGMEEMNNDTIYQDGEQHTTPTGTTPRSAAARSSAPEAQAQYEQQHLLVDKLAINQRAKSFRTDKIHTSREEMELFKTFIVRYISHQEFSFNNVMVPDNGKDQQLTEYWKKANQSRILFMDTEKLTSNLKSRGESHSQVFSSPQQDQGMQQIALPSTNQLDSRDQKKTMIPGKTLQLEEPQQLMQIQF